VNHFLHGFATELLKLGVAQAPLEQQSTFRASQPKPPPASKPAGGGAPKSPPAPKPAEVGPLGKPAVNVSRVSPGAYRPTEQPAQYRPAPGIKFDSSPESAPAASKQRGSGNRGKGGAAAKYDRPAWETNQERAVRLEKKKSWDAYQKAEGSKQVGKAKQLAGGVMRALNPSGTPKGSFTPSFQPQAQRSVASAPVPAPRIRNALSNTTFKPPT